MIIFSGEISEEFQRKVMDEHSRMVNTSFKIVFPILAIICLLNVILMDGSLIEGIILTVLLLGIAFMPFKKRSIGVRWDRKITIDKEKVTVEARNWEKPMIKPIRKIKKVIEEDECYYIVYADKGCSIVCQKDLLQEGSIEEFEKIFEGKIVKEKFN